jgi:hypothetical protein
MNLKQSCNLNRLIKIERYAWNMDRSIFIWQSKSVIAWLHSWVKTCIFLVYKFSILIMSTLGDADYLYWRNYTFDAVMRSETSNQNGTAHVPTLINEVQNKKLKRRSFDLWSDSLNWRMCNYLNIKDSNLKADKFIIIKTSSMTKNHCC